MAEQYVMIAEGAGSDMSPAEAAEAQLKDGTPIEFRLWVQSPLDPQQVAGIHSYLLSRGVVPSEVAYDSGILVVRLDKTPTPASSALPQHTQGVGHSVEQTGQIGQPGRIGAARIGQAMLIIGGIALVGVVIFAWQLASKVGTSLSNPLLIVAVVAIILVYFTFTRKKGQPPPGQQEEQQYG